MELSKWDQRYLDLAQHVSTWSKDPFTLVGAVITHDNKIVSVGFNGFPRKIADDERLRDRELKNELVIHGEMNAYLSAKVKPPEFTLYTYPLIPCPRCAVFLVEAGLQKVVAPMANRYGLSRSLFLEANVELFEV